MTNLYHSFFFSDRRWFQFYQDYWILIGVNDINEEGKFVNMLNKTVNYTNWATNEPQSYVKIDLEIYKCDCVMIALGRGYFATPCSFRYSFALCSQRYNIGKYLDCQLKETSWLINHPSNLSRQTKTHIPYRNLLFIEKSRKDYDYAKKINISIYQYRELFFFKWSDCPKMSNL